MRSTQAAKHVTFVGACDFEVPKMSAKFYEAGRKVRRGSMLSAPTLETITEEPERQGIKLSVTRRTI
ncbi:hypothetical protein ANCCAN_15521 [Ancylostoma caninum]|uniref:Uncharacterized protein n=1 Tax=Ancylostoma caninum TaxID=29170 RepID=A0A368G6E1_ANCCA|nr:hypothetical protein ANCCAN_15521 [Ancylostoma caninum]